MENIDFGYDLFLKQNTLISTTTHLDSKELEDRNGIRVLSRMR